MAPPTRKLTPPENDWLQPGNCISYRLRRVARMTAKKFDDAMRPLGIRNTQFTLLAALDTLGPVSIGDLSEELAIDPTTLNRNLEILSRRGFVQDKPVEDGRVRAVSLTPQGKAKYKKVLPVWRDTQSELLDLLGGKRWPEIVSDLGTIEKASGTAP